MNLAHSIVDFRPKPPLPHTRRRLGDLCIEDRQIIEPASHLSGLRYLGLENVESETGRIIDVNSEQLDETIQASGASFHFTSRHVLYGKLRPYLNKVAVPDFEGRCTTELIPLLPRPNIDRQFLAWLFRCPRVVAAAMREKTGARMPRANLDYVLEVEFEIPDDQVEQRTIAQNLNRQQTSIMRAKHLCEEQIRLMDHYMKSLLTQTLDLERDE